MNFFWDKVFDRFRERRNAAVLFVTLALFVGLGVALCQITGVYSIFQYWPMLVAGIGVLLVTLIWRGIQQWKQARLNQYQSSPLSRDERTKARSKLKTKPGIKSS